MFNVVVEYLMHHIWESTGSVLGLEEAAYFDKFFNGFSPSCRHILGRNLN
jgi:hypothetical protein